MTTIKSILAMGLLILVFGAIGTAQAQDSVGTISEAEGEVVVIRADGCGDNTVGVGADMYQNDTAFVGPESSATINFIDATLMTLGADSAVTIDELVYDPAGQHSSASFDLAGGRLGLVSGDIAKSGDMVVTTPVSTIGIRGTTLPVKAVGVFRAANGQI